MKKKNACLESTTITEQHHPVPQNRGKENRWRLTRWEHRNGRKINAVSGESVDQKRKTQKRSRPRPYTAMANVEYDLDTSGGLMAVSRLDLYGSVVVLYGKASLRCIKQMPIVWSVPANSSVNSATAERRLQREN